MPYRQQRPRREVIAAVLGVLAVLVFTSVMVWILAPATEEPPPPFEFPEQPIPEQPIPEEPLPEEPAPEPPTDTPDTTPSTTPPG